MSSPWGKINAPEPVNLQDIMSEQLAKDLQDKEDQKYSTSEEITNIDFETPPELPEEEESMQSDEKIARMLQQQYDKEHDDNLQRSEKKLNGTSKVSVSFSNYRRAPLNFDFDSDSEEEEVEDLRDRKDWDRFDPVIREFNTIPACGYKKDNGNMITKHDGTMSGRKNAYKMMSFPPEFETGDGAGFDMKISNKVFNSLKMHSKHVQAKKHKMHDKKEDKVTATFAIDATTRTFLYKMINNQILDQINGVISIGKEAVVLHADVNSEHPNYDTHKECAIKVFKTTLSEYKQRSQYIKDDYRFKDRYGKINTLKMVHLWAEKEMHNLQRLKNAGIPAPEVIYLKRHILVMSFIGRDNFAAPKLKHAALGDTKKIVAYEQVVHNMKLLYSKCNLIHADLSEYNILWYDNKCYFIDVSQAVEPTHDNAYYFLDRDCHNISKFFTKLNVPNVATPEELFFDITGCYFRDKLALREVMQDIKMKPHLVDRPGMEAANNFENAWEKTKTGELPVQISSKPNEEAVLVDPAKA